MVANISSSIFISSSKASTVSLLKLFTFGSYSLYNSQNLLNFSVPYILSSFSIIKDTVDDIDSLSLSDNSSVSSSFSISSMNLSVFIDVNVIFCTNFSMVISIPSGYLIVSISRTTFSVNSFMSFTSCDIPFLLNSTIVFSEYVCAPVNFLYHFQKFQKSFLGFVNIG